MQLHWGWAVIGALALGAAVVWWTQPDGESGDSTRASGADAGHASRGHSDAGPTLYRWVDAGGVVNITDHPPKGGHFTIVHVNPDQNIIPMSVNTASPAASRPTSSTAASPAP